MIAISYSAISHDIFVGYPEEKIGDGYKTFLFNSNEIYNLNISMFFITDGLRDTLENNPDFNLILIDCVINNFDLKYYNTFYKRKIITKNCIIIS